MNSSIATFLAAALALFTLGQALAEPAKDAAHAPAGIWGVEAVWATK